MRIDTVNRIICTFSSIIFDEVSNLKHIRSPVTLGSLCKFVTSKASSGVRPTFLPQPSQTYRGILVLGLSVCLSVCAWDYHCRQSRRTSRVGSSNYMWIHAFPNETTKTTTINYLINHLLTLTSIRFFFIISFALCRHKSQMKNSRL